MSKKLGVTVSLVLFTVFGYKFKKHQRVGLLLIFVTRLPRRCYVLQFPIELFQKVHPKRANLTGSGVDTFLIPPYNLNSVVGSFCVPYPFNIV